MRLAEKTIELNFCHQLSLALGSPIWWFGTTQRQERMEGWDVAGDVAGRWMRFQLKASNEVMGNGDRRFRGHHHQLAELQKIATNPLSVFYVLPTLGTIAELRTVNFDLLPYLRFLDAHTLPSGIGAPTKRSGALRKSELHYFDLHADLAGVRIHSDPVEVDTVGPERLVADIRRLMSTAAQQLGVGDPRREAEASLDFLRGGRNRVAAFLPLAR